MASGYYIEQCGSRDIGGKYKQFRSCFKVRYKQCLLLLLLSR